MKRIIGSVILYIFGWKSKFPTEYRIHKMVMIAAPHTSNWDILFTLAAYWKEGLNPKFFVHDSYTKGVFGDLFKRIGAIGVSKNSHQNLVKYAIQLFDTSRELLLLITPEGSKEKAEKWKTGFFNIAKFAKVPLSLGWLDYDKKQAGIGGLFNLSGNFEKDMSYIEKFYENTSPKYPTLYNKKIY